LTVAVKQQRRQLSAPHERLAPVDQRPVWLCDTAAMCVGVWVCVVVFAGVSRQGNV
jgi:hypothetical protein